MFWTGLFLGPERNGFCVPDYFLDQNGPFAFGPDHFLDWTGPERTGSALTSGGTLEPESCTVLWSPRSKADPPANRVMFKHDYKNRGCETIQKKQIFHLRPSFIFVVNLSRVHLFNICLCFSLVGGPIST